MSSDPARRPPAGTPAAETAAAPSGLAIRVRGLSKAYRVYARPEDRLKQMFLGRFRHYYREFWALRDLDLDVRRGEVLGVVGRNGSGKSTLLQMLCGTLTPTAGTLEVRGRVAALLELGAGFNPEFAGRDNVFLNGAILGLTRADMERRYDAIAAFADIGDYIDQPVRTYSSGMYARLAFAVAINVDPEILVVDEALSVGDEAFQRKCFARIRQIRDDGATILFVSHGAASITTLCDRAVLLDHGRRLLTADPKTTVGRYQKLAYAPAEKADAIRAEIVALDAALVADTADDDTAAAAAAPPAAKPPAADRTSDHYDPHLKPQSTVSYASRGVLIEDARVTDLLGTVVNVLAPGNAYRYAYAVTFAEPGYNVRFGMLVKTVIGTELAGGISHAEAEGVEFVPAGSRVTVEFEFENRLNPGTYFLNAGVLGVTGEGQDYLHRVLDVAMFRVPADPNSLATGMVNLMTPGGFRLRTESPADAAAATPA